MSVQELPVIVPDWPAPAGVRTFVTTRFGGVSAAPYDSFNLGGRVGDAASAVEENRGRLYALLPAVPRWLNQVHGITVIDSDLDASGDEADAICSHRANVPCAIMTADCLPVLFADRAGSVVAAAHAGWRGLCGGVLEASVATMRAAPESLIAWLGPAIGPTQFEVGPEVREAFMRHDAAAEQAFRPGKADRWMADIYMLARQRLASAGLAADAIFGGDLCTVSDPSRFFSYRRDGVTGRMASVIWRE
ncbi:peptidoglycan editing factor PgeF [Uliginosibacterium sp. H3]|uniref:Purine nucleoside phosphorylase n=1 Tax=Uliginosibacterium silvisoli TaxID=3114758 RepID=A0ABU6K5T9_9RHOO|nr:peptidoglycan editing factor PgeF [Uliginosibacterium sp. H3]